MTIKNCSRCKKSKPIDDFYKNCGRCKSCDGEYHQIRKMDPKVKQHIKKYHANYMRGWYKDPHNDAAHKIRTRNTRILSKLINNFDAVREETVEKSLRIGKQGFMDHLKSLFEPGMSWDNYGAWHLDHKTNLSDFDLLDPKVIEKANHYTNIRPMWATGPKGNLTRKKSPRIKV